MIRKLAASLFFCLLLSPSLLKAGEGQKSPNVVLIVIDTLRADHLPFYGYSNDTAPFLNSLAKKGVVFERTHSTSSWTAPGTASIVTSLYPHQHGMWMGLQGTKRLRKVDPEIKLNRLSPEIETIAESLKAASYRTYGIADNPNISTLEGFEQGFDRFVTYHYKGAPEVNSTLKSWREEILHPGKTFVYLQYMDPHDPYYRRAPWYKKGKNRRADALARYDSEISYVDQHIKEMFEVFGWGNNTLLIVTSDHGEEFGEHGKTGHGKNLYQESIGVPLFFYGPGIAPSRVKENVSVVDIAPTILSLLKRPANASHAGLDLSPALKGNAGFLSGRPLFAHMWKRQTGGREITRKATIRDNWKYVSSNERDWMKNTLRKDQSKLLFDTEVDPEEKINRHSEHPARAKELEATYLRAENTLSSYPRMFTDIWKQKAPTS